jgi:SAM-dependent methyltransferase
MITIPLVDRLKNYSFYHIIEVADGLFTDGIAQFQRLQRPVFDALCSIPLSGKRVLEVGCRDGLFCFHSERAGASEVIGIDNDLSRGAVELLIPHFQSGVRMYQLNVTDLTPELYGYFDCIICAGVLYHLRYPFHALARLRSVMIEGSILVIETAVFTKHDDLPLLYCPTPTTSPYEPTSVTFFNVGGLVSTLRSLGFRVLSHSLLDSGRPFVDRVTLVCQLDTTLIDVSLDRYWNSTHTNHSSGDPKHRPSYKRRS